MNVKIVGLGAAGNKAAINLIERKVVTSEQVLLINSTLRDVPADYKSVAVQYANARGGCGKEREMAKRLCLESIQDGALNCLDELITDEDELVILIASSEGGTGSGSIPVLAQYYSQVIGIPVHCVVFTGFEEDNRGLQNTIEFFQEMFEDYTIQAISNKKFLDATNHKLKAEKAANDELADRISILIGKDIIESEQNIDETDLYKVSTTPGYMTIGKASLDKIKNTEQYNKIVADMIDNTFSLDITDKTIKRLGVFLNVSERIENMVDFNQTVLKDKLGIPYEIFSHVQYDDSKEQSISFIAGGLNMPIDEVKDIYSRYSKEVEKMNTKKDNFFDFMSGLKTEEKKEQKIKKMFDIVEPVQQKKEVQEIVKDKQDFVSRFNVSIRRKPVEEDQSTVINDSPISGNNDINRKKLTREEYLKNNQY